MVPRHHLNLLNISGVRQGTFGPRGTLCHTRFCRPAATEPRPRTRHSTITRISEAEKAVFQKRPEAEGTSGQRSTVG
eukprot:1856863-Prymnesium_polylepis.1